MSSSFAGRFSQVCPEEDRKWIDAGRELSAEIKKSNQMFRELQAKLKNLGFKENENMFVSNNLLSCLDTKRKRAEEQCSQ